MMTKKPWESLLMSEKTEAEGGGGTGDQTTEETEGQESEGTEESGGDELGALKLSEDQKGYIEKLRKENAKWRTKSKQVSAEMKTLQDRLAKLEGGLKKVVGVEDEEIDPETQLQAMTQQAQKIELDKTLSELAIEHGVGKEGYRFFKFLVNEALESLDEGEELDEDAIAEIALQAKRQGGGVKAGSSVSGKTPGATTDNGVTLEKFVKMSITEKSQLYGKSPDLYNRLMAEAKDKRALI